MKIQVLLLNVIYNFEIHELLPHLPDVVVCGVVVVSVGVVTDVVDSLVTEVVVCGEVVVSVGVLTDVVVSVVTSRAYQIRNAVLYGCVPIHALRLSMSIFSNILTTTAVL